MEGRKWLVLYDGLISVGSLFPSGWNFQGHQNHLLYCSILGSILLEILPGEKSRAPQKVPDAISISLYSEYVGGQRFSRVRTSFYLISFYSCEQLGV